MSEVKHAIAITDPHSRAHVVIGIFMVLRSVYLLRGNENAPTLVDIYTTSNSILASADMGDRDRKY